MMLINISPWSYVLLTLTWFPRESQTVLDAENLPTGFTKPGYSPQRGVYSLGLMHVPSETRDGLFLSEGQLAVPCRHGLTITPAPANPLANVCAQGPRRGV